jgi:hypothetical protein
MKRACPALVEGKRPSSAPPARIPVVALYEGKFCLYQRRIDLPGAAVLPSKPQEKNGGRRVD